MFSDIDHKLFCKKFNSQLVILNAPGTNEIIRFK